MFRHIRRYEKDEEGAATVEFVLLFSFLITIVLSIFETGWLMTQQMMLDRGLDVAMREVRLGLVQSADEAVLKQDICKYAQIFTNCETEITLEVERLNSASAFPQNSASCRDRVNLITPTTGFNPGGAKELKFLRACIVIDPIFPGVGVGLQLPKDASGGYQMVSYTSFVNEP